MYNLTKGLSEGQKYKEDKTREDVNRRHRWLTKVLVPKCTAFTMDTFVYVIKNVIGKGSK